MAEDLWILLGIVMSVVLLATAVVRWSKRRPNLDPHNAEALRLPKITAVAGWLVAPIGLLLIFSAVSGAMDPEDKAPLLICGIALFLVAALLVASYANCYIIIRDDQIIQRTVTRRLRTIRYDNIDKCRKSNNGAASMLKLWGYDGVVIKFNAAAFDASPVLAALERRQTPGR
ncbi:hypothetical protein GCM10009715_28730 [Paeniglutamicibacter psychrophenolicus]|uniref:PH domain-containing protein n=1 Tax=Paeniglutamicibacter psychrophenolicus TaxID=257454 RepID=A0ABS4WGI3_9MICC|nr:hypothetical protein [Paeniglutamicibacter psychrophenolicus]MBP2375302.1 hypothetical protein [Paeniglutamicibacter psychrophenolicus]